LAWEKGRQLKYFDCNTYTYNAEGIRTSKTVNGVKHTYILDGTKILRETWGENTIIPLYDNEESVCGIIYNGTPYYFHKNLQGDIISIVDANGDFVARYSYDAWGVCSVADANTVENYNIATINPFRYRGYYYDTEIGMYYLQSRYYDPAVGRFVNADDTQMVSTSSQRHCNLYIYCNNDPVNDTDFSGNIGWSTVFKVLEYIFDFFVKIAQSAASMSRQMSDVINSIKRAKSLGASREWINTLRKKKKDLVSPRALGAGKIQAVATALGLFVTIFPYLSYIKKLADGVFLLAEFLVDIIVEILGIAGNALVSLICKFIPFAGFLLGWALGIVVDMVMRQVFNCHRINNIKRIYANRVKSSNSWKKWIRDLGYSIRCSF